MFCYKCGEKLPDGALFCQFCGVPQNNGAQGSEEQTGGAVSEGRGFGDQPVEQRDSIGSSQPVQQGYVQNDTVGTQGYQQYNNVQPNYDWQGYVNQQQYGQNGQAQGYVDPTRYGQQHGQQGYVNPVQYAQYGQQGYVNQQQYAQSGQTQGYANQQYVQNGQVQGYANQSQFSQYGQPNGQTQGYANQQYVQNGHVQGYTNQQQFSQYGQQNGQPQGYAGQPQGYTGQAQLAQNGSVNQPQPEDGKTASKDKKTEKKSGDKAVGAKKSRKKIIIPAVIAAVVALGVGAYFLFVKKPKTAEEKALDRYFAAWENMDLAALDKACYPEGSTALLNMGYDGKRSLGYLYSGNNSICFTMGALISGNDNWRMDHDLMSMYLKSYDFSSFDDGGMEERRKAMEDNDEFRKIFSDLKVDYKVVKMMDSDQVTFQERSGRKLYDVDDPITWMENRLHSGSEYYGTGSDIKVTDVKVAVVNVHWSYGSKKYGYDKSWWNNEKYISILSRYSGSYYGYGRELPIGRGKTIMVDYKDYDSLIRYMDSIEYELILYKTDGKWYVYPERLIPGGWGPSSLPISYSNGNNNYEHDDGDNSGFTDSAKKSDDITMAGTVLTAFQTCLADEDCYDEVYDYCEAKNTGGEVVVVSIHATDDGEKLSSEMISATGPYVKEEMLMSLSSCPIRYTDDGAAYYVVTYNHNTGSMGVYISKDGQSLDWQIQPEMDEEYK